MTGIKRKIYSYSALFSLVSICLVVFFAYPGLKEINAILTQILTDRANMALISAQSRELAVFKEEYELYKTGIEKIEKLFVDSQNPIDLIKFLEKSAADRGIASNISLSPYDGNSDFQLTQVSLKGNFSSIIEFARKIENGPYLINIKSFSTKKLFKGDQKENSYEIEANLLLEATVKK